MGVVQGSWLKIIRWEVKESEMGYRALQMVLFLLLLLNLNSHGGVAMHLPIGIQPLSNIAMHKAVLALHPSASIKANPSVLGEKVRLIDNLV